MLDLNLNFRYINGLPLYHFQDKKEPLPASYAMVWCMLATSFGRIFTKEDMKEFLFRLAITLHSMNLVENWLIKDHLMGYSVNGMQYVLTLNDIVMHFGIELCDSYDNLDIREKYYDNLLGGIKGAMFVGSLSGFSILNAEKSENEDGISINLAVAKDYLPEITPELIAKAEFFANDLMKFIPADIFESRCDAILVKEKELCARRERISELPVFDINKVPRATIKECLEIIYIPEHANLLFEDAVMFSKEARPLIYLGWLYANDLLDLTGDLPESKEGIPLNYDDYNLENGGVNLNITISDYNIEELSPLLKGLFINTI